MLTTPWIPEIQLIQSKFFRTGPYTHLHIKHCTDTNILEWEFTFMDFGMIHTIKSHSNITLHHNGTAHVDGGVYSCAESVWKAVFEGHYARFIEEMHSDIGFIALKPVKTPILPPTSSLPGV